MNKKAKLMMDIDNAIDRQDMDAVGHGLEALSSVLSPIAAEEPLLFSARIKKLSKEKHIMSRPEVSLKIIIAAAAVAVLGVGAYAASTLNWFSFANNDNFVTVRTTGSMTEQEARELVGESYPDPDALPEGALAQTAGSEPFTFDSVEEAARALDMRLVLPGSMPDMALENVQAQTADFGGMETRTAWINYADDDGRRFGVTVVRSIIPAGSDITSYTQNKIDPGSYGTYKSKSGAQYKTMTESNPDGTLTAHIATTTVGEYEYALVFVGFDEAQRQAIIDSADLSPMK